MAEEETVVEQTQEGSQEQKQDQAEESGAQEGQTQEPSQAKPSLDIDFSDIGFPDEPVAPQEPNYEAVIGDIVQKVLEQQKVKPEAEKSEEDDDDMTYLSKRDLAEYEQKVTQKIMQNLQDQQHATETIQKTVYAAEVVRNQYAEKFSKTLADNGFDLSQNQQLKNVAAMLFDNLKIQAAAQSGRLTRDPSTGQNMAILTPQEMKNVTKQHWDMFSKTYLPGYTPVKTTTATNPLSAAANGSKPESAIDSDDAYKQFMDKKAKGQETLGDALNLLLKSGTKR